jgi:hypothetical protein
MVRMRRLHDPQKMKKPGECAFIGRGEVGGELKARRACSMPAYRLPTDHGVTIGGGVSPPLASLRSPKPVTLGPERGR